MILVNGELRTLAEALAYVRRLFGVESGPVLSSERA
jgi:hypothetical protein